MVGGGPVLAVLGCSSLLSQIFARLDDPGDKEALSQVGRAVLAAVASFASPVYTRAERCELPYIIPRFPAGVVPERPSKLVLVGYGASIAPHQVLSADTGAPWLHSPQGATLGHLRVNVTADLAERWLQEISSHATQLQHLDIASVRWADMQRLPLPPTLTALELVDLSNVEGEEDNTIPTLSWLAPLSRLRSLDVVECSDVDASTLPVSTLTAVRTLRCRAGSQLSHFSALTCLMDLDLEEGSGAALQSLPALGSLTHLWFDRPGTVPADLGRFSGLKCLVLDACDLLVDLRCLAAATRLHMLQCPDCPCLTDISGVSRLPALQLVDLRGSAAVSSVAPLLSLPRLVTVCVTSVPDGLRLLELAALEYLLLDRVAGLQDLCPLSRLSRLMRLSLLQCPELVSLEGISRLSRLSRLLIEGCSALESAAGHPCLVDLTECTLRACGGLTAVEGWAALPRLSCMSANGCGSLQQLDLSGCSSLRSVDVSGCRHMQTLICRDCPRLGPWGISRDDCPDQCALDLRGCRGAE